MDFRVNRASSATIVHPPGSHPDSPLSTLFALKSSQFPLIETVVTTRTASLCRAPCGGLCSWYPFSLYCSRDKSSAFLALMCIVHAQAAPLLRRNCQCNTMFVVEVAFVKQMSNYGMMRLTAMILSATVAVCPLGLVA